MRPWVLSCKRLVSEKALEFGQRTRFLDEGIELVTQSPTFRNFLLDNRFIGRHILAAGSICRVDVELEGEICQKMGEVLGKCIEMISQSGTRPHDRQPKPRQGPSSILASILACCHSFPSAAHLRESTIQSNNSSMNLSSKLGVIYSFPLGRIEPELRLATVAPCMLVPEYRSALLKQLDGNLRLASKNRVSCAIDCYALGL